MKIYIGNGPDRVAGAGEPLQLVAEAVETHLLANPSNVVTFTFQRNQILEGRSIYDEPEPHPAHRCSEGDLTITISLSRSEV